jgi:O-succinylbenzoic acid--CoA ligase
MTKIFFQNSIYSVSEFLEFKTKNQFLNGIKNVINQWKTEDRFSLFTSGSTGKPKQIFFERKQLIFSAQQTINAFNLEKGDKLHLCLSTEHAAGFMMVIRALLGNMNLVIEESSSYPKDLENLDFSAFVPMQIQNILKNEGAERLNKLKTIIIGGGALSDSLTQEIQKIRIPVYSTYGMTETLTHIAIRRLNPLKKYFNVLPENKISQDERGCLIINSPVTNHKDLVTNDLVNFISEKEFEFLGRVDNVVNSGGYKIHIEELENKIEVIINHQNFFLFKEKDDLLGERLLMVCEGKHENLKTLLKNSLHRYEIPKEIYFVDEIFRAKLGKVDKQKTLEKINI